MSDIAQMRYFYKGFGLRTVITKMMRLQRKYVTLTAVHNNEVKETVV